MPRDPRVWRDWGREAPRGALSEFLSHYDAGETELHSREEDAPEPGIEGRYVIEVKRVPPEEEI